MRLKKNEVNEHNFGQFIQLHTRSKVGQAASKDSMLTMKISLLLLVSHGLGQVEEGEAAKV